MNSAPNPTNTCSRCSPSGFVVVALAASASLHLMGVDAFSVSATRATTQLTPTISHPNSMIITTPSSLQRRSVVSFGSLRELLESSSENENDDGNKRKDPNVSSNDFNKLLNYSRSKFTDTKFRSRSVYGTGSDDERGQHLDRLSTFSFSQNAPKSQSEGGSSGETEMMVEISDDEDNESDGDEEQEGQDESSSADSPEDDTLEDEVSKDAFDYDNDMVADNFNSMVGVYYSKRKFPSREKDKISDEKDMKGLHGDRLSTFSFSSNQPVEKGPQEEGTDSPVAKESNEVPDVSSSDEIDPSFGVDNFHNSINVAMRDTSSPVNRPDLSYPDGLDNHADRLSTFSLSGKDKVERLSPPGGEEREIDEVDDKEVPDAKKEDIDIQFGVDNFHNNINVAMRDTSSPVNKPDLSYPDGLDNHADRLSTFSLSSKEDKEESSNSAVPTPTGVSRPRGSTVYDDDVNHDDRLGTFSFASGMLQSGSTSSKGTTATSPLPSTSESDIKPPQYESKEYKDPSPPNEADKGTYTPPQKGSLSSLASSVLIKTRNDRIKDIKEATDPRLIHPDGQNIPRLNRKGDVMSTSTMGGKPNIFQRIDKVNAELESGEGNDVSGTTGTSKDVGASEGIKTGGDASLEKEESSNSNEKNVGDSLGSGDCFIGFDLGTSGARMSIVEKKPADSGEDATKWEYKEVFTESLVWDDNLQYDGVYDWRAAIDTLLLRAQGTEVLARVKAICVSGTSATCCLVNKNSLSVARKARMYNYDILSSSDSNEDDSPAERVMKLIEEYVPEKHTARATTGSLAKLLLWNEEKSVAGERLCHQSDYVSMSLMYGDGEDKECAVTSDWHNCLKLGYDVRNREFPDWMNKLLKEGANIPNPSDVLPSKVISPGEPFGVISPIVASKYGLSSNVMLVGGTTDSNAAFFAAAGAKPEYGTAVTSLGSTLAIKQLSKTFVEDASRGVYSHRFPRFGSSSDGEEDPDAEEAWLIGGASNVGCAILRKEGFSNEELVELSADIDPSTDSPLSYYPLMKKGERFPVADSQKEPVLTPKPDSRKEYLHGILQGIGDVERDGFRILGELGASPDRPKVVLSCGGGARNDMWISMRERRLRDICNEGQNVEVKRAENTEASYGAALLAAASFEG